MRSSGFSCSHESPEFILPITTTAYSMNTSSSTTQTPEDVKGMDLREEAIRVRGMHCASCEAIITSAVRSVAGVADVEADHKTGTVRVRYDARKCGLDAIRKAITDVGYDLRPAGWSEVLGIMAVVGVVLLLGRSGGTDIDSRLASGANALVLFTIGVLTSLHCAGMCGGILLSQTLGSSSGERYALRPALLYNLGRVISYTALGGAVGAVGSALALTPMTKAVVMLLAGLFMVVAGANMAGWKVLRKLLIRLPLRGTLPGDRTGMRKSGPLVVGLLNGLMPCGPLQTMQIYALGTGSFAKGAFTMLVFALGTVPVMLLIGVLSGLLSKGFTQRLARLSGALVIGLGIIMFNRGLTLAGYGLPVPGDAFARGGASSGQVAKALVENGVQTVTMVADSRGYLPNLLYVQKGVPLRWVIEGRQINSCNNQIIVPSLGISKTLRTGENVVEFTPGEGDIRFSCWMGMISGLIRVVDDLTQVDVENPDTAPPPAGGCSCCIGEGTVEELPPSIYGDDITKVPTERLVKKAIVSGGIQEATFKGLGWELEPLIVVVQSGVTVRLTLDLTESDIPDTTYWLISFDTGKTVASVRGEKGIVEMEFAVDSEGGYALVGGNRVAGVVEAVEDLRGADLERIRGLYLVGN